METLVIVVGVGLVLIGGLVFALTKKSKDQGKLEEINSVNTKTAEVLKEQLDIANKTVTPDEAYAGLKSGGKKK